MNEREIVNLIRQVIRQDLAPVVMGLVVSNESEFRSTIQRYSNEGPRDDIRSIQPFGLASKAPPGTQAFIVPGGFDQTNQNILGHYDESKPKLADGEVALYDAFGHVFYLSQGKIRLGTEASSENLVLGQQLKTLLSQVLELLATHTHPGPGAPPSNASEFEMLKSSPVQDEKILSQISFTE